MFINQEDMFIADLPWEFILKLIVLHSDYSITKIIDEYKALEMNNNRFCVDCKTTRTPLWRKGPYGPRSLCNACGIRYRKRKTANIHINPEIRAETSVSTSCGSEDQDHNHIGFYGGYGTGQVVQRPSSCSSSLSLSSSQVKKQRSTKDNRSSSSSRNRSFSEVEEAAVMLMSLSHSSHNCFLSIIGDEVLLSEIGSHDTRVNICIQRQNQDY